jgi:acyl-CoA dehydrogenase
VDFAFDERTEQLRAQLLDFMDSHVYPAEEEYHAHPAGSWSRPPVVKRLQAEARGRGLWNLFLPRSEHGAGLTNLQYAPLAEIMGRSPGLAPEACNCSAPDTGNMEVLAQFGTPQQQERWLRPLLEAEIRSAFCMTEPDVASSDARNIQLSIRRDGDDYVLDGRKWWSTGAMAPECRILIVMGVTDPAAEPYRRQSMILVPRDTQGVTVVRPLSVFGYDDAEHGGHAEVVFTGARVPAANLLLGEGDGFRIAQERLGPGRIHHCMRSIGVAERALELLCRRAASRVAFGKAVAQQGVVQDWIAEARIRIEQARLLTLKAAWLMDTVGNKGARVEIAAIKVVAPQVAAWVLDKAIQVHGGGGVSGDFPLARMAAAMRTLRLADGPDEVHKATIARRELAAYLPRP